MLARFWQFVISTLGQSRIPTDRAGKFSSSHERNDGENALPGANSPDELADELLGHMLECGCCLNPVACSCPIYRDFQAMIGLKGTATKPALYAV